MFQNLTFQPVYTTGAEGSMHQVYPATCNPFTAVSVRDTDD